MDAARQAIIALLQEHVKGDIVLETPEQDFGDLAFPCFPLAREWKKSPQQIAKELAAKIVPNLWVRSVEARGPYVNFFLQPEALAKSILITIQKAGIRFGQREESGKRIVIEYSCPNTNKPLHLGHLRNIFLGKSVASLLTRQG
ncbi:MAG TPA: arginine--tRNA ligase, partial [Candidatus Nanoarchaeia archaeon]|nr:arginine--tRNA ligase [Candidatus Nanoarchaeia archaeon]